MTNEELDRLDPVHNPANIPKEKLPHANARYLRASEVCERGPKVKVMAWVNGGWMRDEYACDLRETYCTYGTYPLPGSKPVDGVPPVVYGTFIDPKELASLRDKATSFEALRALAKAVFPNSRDMEPWEAKVTSDLLFSQLKPVDAPAPTKKMRKDYKIVSSRETFDCRTDFEKSISKLLNNGWSLQGGVSYTPSGECAQALTREVEVES